MGRQRGIGVTVSTTSSLIKRPKFISFDFTYSTLHFISLSR